MRFQFLFHSPTRGSFHLSLTVLVHYRCLHVFSLTSWSWHIHTGFHVPHATLGKPKRCFSLEYRAITFYGVHFQVAFSTKTFSNSFPAKGGVRFTLTPK